MDLVEILEAQPLGGKAGAERVGARVGEHALDLGLEDVRIGQPSLGGDLDQLRVGEASPQEERQPRRQRDIADRTHPVPRRAACRRLLEAEDEVGARQDALQRGAHADIESALGVALPEQAHQPVDLGAGDRAAEGLRGEPLDDPACARRLLVRAGGAAGHDPLPRRSAAHPGDVVRAADGHVPQVRHPRDSVGIPDLLVGQRPLVRRCQVLDRPLGHLDEGGRNPVRAGGHRDPLGHDLDAPGILPVHPPVERDERHAHAVDRHLDLFVERRGLAEEVPGRFVLEGEPEEVVAVGHEVVDDRNPAAGPERRARDVFALLGVARHLVCGFGRRRVRVAQRQPAHLAGGGKVRFEQRRGEVLHVGDVVEARADRLAGKVGRSVDIDPEKIADRGRVLGPVESLEGAAAGVRVARGGRVDLGLHAGNEGGDLVLRRPPDARRRHHPGAQLADHLLRDRRIRDRVGCVEFLQGEIADEAAFVVAANAVFLNDVLVGGRHDIARSADLRGRRGVGNDRELQDGDSRRRDRQGFRHCIKLASAKPSITRARGSADPARPNQARRNLSPSVFYNTTGGPPGASGEGLPGARMPAQPPAASTTLNDIRSPSLRTTISTSSPGSNSPSAAM